MPSSAPKTGPTDDQAEDESEMTSIMSADQRKVLQEAAATGAETLERDTAKPPPGEGQAAVAIPKAPAVPNVEAGGADAPKAEKAEAAEKVPKTETKSAEAGAAAPAAEPSLGKEVAAAVRVPARAPGGTVLWRVVSFVLLTAAVLWELRP
jgi:hypothetical protein